MARFRLKPELCPWLPESEPVKPAENREVADFLEKLRSIQMDDDIEGDDPPEYSPPADKSREVFVGLLTFFVVVAFFFGACWLADHIGGPVQ